MVHEFGNIAATFSLRLIGHPLSSYRTLHASDRFQVLRNSIHKGDLNCNFLSNPLEVHTTHLLDFMVEYQLAQFIKEPAELMPNRILVLKYLLHVHPGGDTLIKVKGEGRKGLRYWVIFGAVLR